MSGFVDAEYLPEARSWRDLFRYAVRVATGEQLILLPDEQQSLRSQIMPGR